MTHLHRISNSKANTWRRCPKKFEYKYVRDLRPKRKGEALTRGSWLHGMLMEHYDGEGWRKAHARLTKGYSQLFEEEREDLGDLPGETKRIMRAYESYYKKEDLKYHVIDSEVDELVELPNGVKFNLIIDLIMEDKRGGLWLWDHKTVGNFMDEDFKLLDTQLARYFWAAQVLGYKPLRGVMFNEIRTKPPTVPRLLKNGTLSKAKKMDTDVNTYLMEIKKHGLDPGNYRDVLQRLSERQGRFFRRSKLPKDATLTKRQMADLIKTGEEIEEALERNRFPRSVSKNCRWDCEYKDLCIVELHGGNAAPLIKSDFEVRTRGVD